MKNLPPDYITKIEGHGLLHVNFKKNQARLEITEGERLFEALVLEKPASNVPFLVSRICGVCPTAHYFASIKALESALNVHPSEATILLRKLMLATQIIQSHNLHLFFLALPDYLQLKKDENIAEKYPDEFHIALNIKRMADKILEVVGGRAIHPINPVIGGFSKKITHDQLSELRFDLENILDDAEYVVDLFAKIKYQKLKNPTIYLALKSKNYEIYDGQIYSQKRKNFPAINYKNHLVEKITNYSTAKIAYLKKTPIMTGALARININGSKLNLKAKSKLQKLNINFNQFNSFYNIPAQALEILHFTEEAIKIIDQLQKLKLDTAPDSYKMKSGEGVGAIEAPRGILYHYYKLDGHGKVVKADILAPTGQSLSNLEKDCQKLVKSSGFLRRKNKIKKIESLIRAYDPCITCSVH